MSYVFSQLARDVWVDLGRVLPFHQFLATGGTTTTIQNTAMNSDNQQQDDNYSVDWTACVTRDAAGAAAAPEGELQRISAFASGATPTFTVDTAFSAAVASGDEVMIANADIPLREMYRSANRALRAFGDVESVDSTLTILADTDRYTLPAGTKRYRPVSVEVADDATDARTVVSGWKVTADGYLWIPDGDYSVGDTIYLTSIGPHATLAAWNSAISEDIHPELAIAATTVHALQWYIGTQGGGSDFDKQRLNKALSDLAVAEAKFPVKRSHRQAKWFVSGREYRYPGDQSIYDL